MATITTRSGKGSALTFTEMDSNFTNLNTDKLELSGGTLTGNLVMAAGKTITIGNDYTFPTADGTVGQVLQTDGNGNLSFVTGAGGGIALTDLSVGAEGTASGDGSLAYNNTTGVFTYTPPVLSGLSGDSDDITEGATNQYYTDAKARASISVGSELTASGDGAITYTSGTGVLQYTPPTIEGLGGIVADTTPQLGGDLDVNGNDIIATGTGSVKIGDGANKYVSVDLSANNLVMGNIGLDMVDESITTSTTNGGIKLRPNGTGKVDINKKTTIYSTQSGGAFLNIDNYNGSAGPDFGYPSPGISIASKGTGSNEDYPGILIHSSSATAGYPNIWIQKNNSDDPATPDYMSNGQRLFAFYGAAWDNNSLGYGLDYYNKTCSIEYKASETHSASGGGGKIEFYTQDNGGWSATGTLKMTMDDEIQAHTAIRLDEVSTPTTTTDKGWIYAKDVSGTAEVFVKDAAGNETQISPHNAQGEWEYFSRNVKTGKTVRINMEEMIRDIEQLTGKTYIKDE